MWVDATLPLPIEFEMLKLKFLNQFWDEDAKYEQRNKVLTGSFQRSRGENLSTYAMEKLILANNCDPPIEENELIYIIIRQFPYNIQSHLRSAEPLTMDKLLKLLGHFDLIHGTSQRVERPTQNVAAARYQRNRSSWWRRPEESSRAALLEPRPFSSAVSPHQPTAASTAAIPITSTPPPLLPIPTTSSQSLINKPDLHFQQTAVQSLNERGQV